MAGQRIYFVSLGCPKNQVDTEVMLGQVAAAGHTLVDAPGAIAKQAVGEFQRDSVPSGRTARRDDDSRVDDQPCAVPKVSHVLTGRRAAPYGDGRIVTVIC